MKRKLTPQLKQLLEKLYNMTQKGTENERKVAKSKIAGFKLKYDFDDRLFSTKITKVYGTSRNPMPHWEFHILAISCQALGVLCQIDYLVGRVEVIATEVDILDVDILCSKIEAYVKNKTPYMHSFQSRIPNYEGRVRFGLAYGILENSKEALMALKEDVEGMSKKEKKSFKDKAQEAMKNNPLFDEEEDDTPQEPIVPQDPKLNDKGEPPLSDKEMFDYIKENVPPPIVECSTQDSTVQEYAMYAIQGGYNVVEILQEFKHSREPKVQLQYTKLIEYKGLQYVGNC